MSEKFWDVIVVGGGPAGIAAALKLARRNVDVLVVEAAVYPGAENWSGAVYFAENLADPDVLGVEELERAPFERRVVKRGFFSCNGPTLVGAEYKNVETFEHCYTVLRPVYDRYLAERARQLGATILNETTVDGLIREGGRVVGVHTDRGPIYGGLVFLAEGDASHLVSKEGFEGEAVRSKKNGQPAFLQGVKEVIAMDPGVIEDRFGVGAEEACCYEVLLRNGVVDGRPVRLNMAAFIYTNRDSLSVGLVLPLDNLAAFNGSYNNLMEWFKDLPPMRRIFEGGESTSYGAKIIRGGGYRELPQLVDHGVAIGGAATGIGIDFPYPNFTGPATVMGSLFADAALRLREQGAEPSREKLQELYVEPLQRTRYYRDVEHLKDWPAFIEHSKEFFGRQIDLLNGSMYMLNRRDISLPRKWWELTRLVGETLKGKWLRTIADLHRGSKALRLGRYVLKHLPVALLMTIPNTLLAIVPLFRARSRGALRFSFWGQDERTGKTLRPKWPLSARVSPALSRAAHVLYANDDRAIPEKLDRCVGLVMRSLSLWEIAAVAIGAVALALTRIVQRATDLVRYAISKPTLDELKASYYGRWLTGWRDHTEMTPAELADPRSHDAKLGEISYSGRPESHIKVFFPPEKPGTLEDPSKSSLWSVCPAAVYQINVDRTLHASVTVNFENCVKCETCWRIEPSHVDWTRFGQHRLIYEIYTPADGALRRIISERESNGGPAIATDYWAVSLGEPSGNGKDNGSDAAPPDLRHALEAALSALALAEAKSEELHRDIWHGPRVLQPGQVDWYRGAVAYFAALAEDAAELSLADPIRSWLASHDQEPEQATLLQLHQDTGEVARGIRQHAKARRFFAAEADARQIATHHLTGIRSCLNRVAELAGVRPDPGDPVSALRSLETESRARSRARRHLREHLEELFDRTAIRRLEHGGDLEAQELELLRGAAAAALGDSQDRAGFTEWGSLKREDVLAELARADASLAALVATHLAAVEALRRAAAPDAVLDPLTSGERLAAFAGESRASSSDSGWNGDIPFVLAAAADAFVARTGDRVALFEAGSSGIETTPTTPIGLMGAGVSRLKLNDSKPSLEAGWTEADEASLFAIRARDLAAIALGGGTIMAERAIDHARSRIQFPDHFQDIDGRDAVGKFGAVRAHIAHIEASRLAIETLLADTRWSEDASGLEARLAKVAVTDLFGPDLPSITYRTGQVIGGTAFSEDDIIAKVYRDSSVFTHYLRENAELNAQIGARMAEMTDGSSALAAVAPSIQEDLTEMGHRPISGPERDRLHAADKTLAQALLAALETAGHDEAAVQVIHDLAGEMVTRLYVWARALLRADRRLEGAMPAAVYVEATRLWGDSIEERLEGLAAEFSAAAPRVDLGHRVFKLGRYPDEPIASTDIDFDYARDIIDGDRDYRSGGFLLQPLDLNSVRFTPEALWVDDDVRGYHEHLLEVFHERFIAPDYDPPFERHIEQLHYIPRGHIDWTREQGFFAVPVPEEFGGQGRTKVDYYNLCQTSLRLADVSHTLTVQAHFSIGTTPILLGLYQDVPGAERDLRNLVEEPDTVDEIAAGIEKLLAMLQTPNLKQLIDSFMALGKEVRSTIGKSRVLKKVVFGRFMSKLEAAGLAGMKRDLDGFKKGLEAALESLEGWLERAEAELEEMPLRRVAHDFYLRLISSRMISAFALTEPSAGSDTARIRTDARTTSRRVYTDEDGIKYFYLDEESKEDRRNIADMRRFEFDGPRILYRWSDDAPPAEVQSHEYSYGDEEEEKYIYFMAGERRVDVHDMALIRERNGEETYEFYLLNGAKMWITNGHIAGVMSLYARTPLGPTGFMVDTHTEGFLVGKDEEKMGQRGSPTNEITLTNVRVPRECVIGIEGRGQENALETLNVGRAGLCISAGAGMQEGLIDARGFLEELGRTEHGPSLYRLGMAAEEMFATESMANELIGLFDYKKNDGLRMESAMGKFFGTDGSHRFMHQLESVYGILGQTQEWEIEKDRRDGRVMTIYEGTNEVQQFLLLKDLIDMVGPRIEKSPDDVRVDPGDSPYAEEIETYNEMLDGVRQRVQRTRETFGSSAWQRALFQPVFFRLSRMAVWAKVVDSVLYRAHWIHSNLTAENDAARRAWADTAARAFVARAGRAYARLARSFDRDFELLREDRRPAELTLAEMALDLADAAGHAEPDATRIERGPINRQLDILVAVEQAPHLAPRPRLSDGDLAEHVYTLTAGDRRALKLALALKEAAPSRVTVTVAAAAPRHAEVQLRKALAAGADRAVLLDTGGEIYKEHARAEALCDAIRERGIAFDLLLAGASEDSPSGGRMPGRFSVECGIQWVPGVTDLWIGDDGARFASERFPDTVLRSGMPAIAAVTAGEGEPQPDFSAAGFMEALRKPLDVEPFPTGAERSDERFATAAAAAASSDGDEEGQVGPEHAAEMLLQVGDLGDGAGGPTAGSYDGQVETTDGADFDLRGVTFIAELEEGELARSARAPLAAAADIAARSDMPLNGLVLSEPMDESTRRAIAGQLNSSAPFARIVFAENPVLGRGTFKAHAEALVRLVGPEASNRPTYLVTSPWLADALPIVAEALRDSGLRTEELTGVSQVEFAERDGLYFVRPALDRKLRARRFLPLAGEGMRLLWCEPEVAANSAAENGAGENGAGESGDGGPGGRRSMELLVQTAELELDYDPQADVLAAALADAREELGVVTLENAEFIIDVGAGLGSGENLETVVDPLRQTLLELGAPHVEIGASRKVTQDLSWLPDDRQIGQTGVRVNPRVLIALGISGAPQHIDYVGDRAVIFAFNLDAQAPLMTLNQRRERPKVYPIVGDLFEMVPKFIEALKAHAGQGDVSDQ